LRRLRDALLPRDPGLRPRPRRGLAVGAAGHLPGASAGDAAPARAAGAVRALPAARRLVDRQRPWRVEPAAGRDVHHHGGRDSAYRDGRRDRDLGHPEPSIAHFWVAILFEATRDPAEEEPPWQPTSPTSATTTSRQKCLRTTFRCWWTSGLRG